MNLRTIFRCKEVTPQASSSQFYISRTGSMKQLSYPYQFADRQTNHAQHLPAKCLATETNSFTFNLTNNTILSYRWVSDIRLTWQFAVFRAVTPCTFRHSLRLVNRAESSKMMVPIYHPHESATNLPNYVASR